ncbi:copper chaperone PCu(A)C [Nocardia abscessus]|uniref:copper chaperone PCu(A)C n=1 Tax=Nocardia abscessus TaxID=120957 RepID=UPI002459093D|nr:copper chaperone PCu(A)C [Nocardia abscessus]
MHTFTRQRTTRFLPGAMAAAAAALLLTACSSADATQAAASAATVTISDKWGKAADSGMSAAFGDLTNSGDTPRTIVSATSPASERIELHEVVTDANGTKAMRPKRDGFVVPAHGRTQLRPGGDHIMFMGLLGPLRTGSQTSVTLTFDDGSSTTFTAQVRDFSGNQENYVPDHAGGESHTGAQTPAHGG